MRTFSFAHRLQVAAVALVALASFTLAGCGSDSSDSAGGDGNSLVKLNLGLASSSALYGPVFYAQQEGIFKKHHLDVTVQSLSASAAAAAFASNSVDVVNAGTAALTQVVKTHSGKIILYSGYTAFSVLGKSDIGSIAGLKGKTVAATAPGGANDLILHVALQQAGLDADKDVKIAYLGGNDAVVAAIKHGSIDAAVLSPPSNLQAEALGFKDLGDVGQLSSGSTYQVTDKFAKAHADAVQNWVDAMVEATKAGIADPDGMKKALAKGTGDSKTENLDTEFDIYKGVWAAAPYPDDLATKALEFVAQTEPSAKNLTPADVVDNSYVEKATAS